jgi:integrase
MASVVPNHARGTYQIQWHDGVKWRRVTVTRRPKGHKKGDRLPATVPGHVKQELVAYQKREDDARRRALVVPPETVAEFLGDYHADYCARRRPKSAVQLRFAADRFLEFCAAAKVSRLDAVTPEVVDRYLVARATGAIQGRPGGRGDGKAAHGTLRKEVGFLGGAWARGVKLRRLPENPWAKPDVPGKPARGTKSSWTPEEFARLRAQCRPWLQSLLTLGVNTGIRITALAGLEWRDVAWGKGAEGGLGTVTVRPELDKIGLGYPVPMSDGAHELLAKLDEGGPRTGRVLRGQAGAPIGSISYVGTAIRRACADAGLPRPDAPCHALRRSFGRWAVFGYLTGEAVPLYVVSKWMGHTSVAMTELYLDIRHEESQQWMTRKSPPAGGGPPVSPA